MPIENLLSKKAPPDSAERTNAERHLTWIMRHALQGRIHQWNTVQMKNYDYFLLTPQGAVYFIEIDEQILRRMSRSGWARVLPSQISY